MASKFEVKRAANGFMFNLKASNGQIILTSEIYVDKKGAKKGIASVQKNSQIDSRYEMRTTTSGDPYLVLLAANKEVIGKSETYKSSRSCKNCINSVKKNAPEAQIVDLTE